MVAALFADFVCLIQYESEGEPGISSMVAMPAAYRVLEQQEAFQIFPAEAGKAEAGG